ncbi:MAG: phosphate ABC transporter substrate-binding protein PstS [Acidobacteria bacterium]|nr:phosphate ABC transporter substrate-binding protein PstS [Acidobacteriota bacterium]MBI3278682.1 phosphate ABC transporter substrate-binding protein PstS [Acidobacteriota bacterium]
MSEGAAGRFVRILNAFVCLALTFVGARPSRADILVNAAGATFPYPIYARWFDQFHRLRPGDNINYQSVGSGAGIRQLLNGVVDFGASDRPMTDEQLLRSSVKILHFPSVLGAVVPVYNIPKVDAELNFTPAALAGIFLGAIRRWNDPEIASANPGVALPDADILPVHRSDGSGTTYIWTEFLLKTNAVWKSRVGAGASVSWPAGLGAKGNEGVAGIVKQTPWSCGYVELVYASHNRIRYGRVRNASGRFARADVRTIKAAAASVANQMPDDFRVSITNAPGRDAYPIASFTWLLTPAKVEDARKREAIRAFLRWMLQSGQRVAEPLGYAPLPAPVAAKALQAIEQIR